MNALRLPNKTTGLLRTVVLGAVLAAVAGTIAAAPARADDDWHRRHEWREHYWRWHHGPYAYVAPGYPGYAPGYPGYAYAPPPPPPVVYAPPPVVYAPPPPIAPGINLIVPLHFR
jgi:hypothetical protein